MILAKSTHIVEILAMSAKSERECLLHRLDDQKTAGKTVHKVLPYAI